MSQALASAAYEADNQGNHCSLDYTLRSLASSEHGKFARRSIEGAG